MAINSIGQDSSVYGDYADKSSEKDKTKLGKDDFMTLLLVEMQHQDPTEPMDSEKILSQTSQLATLESAENTNKTLEDLAKSLGSSQQFSTIAAIGKTADLGSDTIRHEKNTSSTFEMYFPDNVNQGSIEITDGDGQVIKTIDVGTKSSGVYQFTWDGTNGGGNLIDDGVFHANAKYTNDNGETKSTKLGAYPIESVRFDDGKTLVKLGSNYVSLDKVKEVY